MDEKSFLRFHVLLKEAEERKVEEDSENLDREEEFYLWFKTIFYKILAIGLILKI